MASRLRRRWLLLRSRSCLRVGGVGSCGVGAACGAAPPAPALRDFHKRHLQIRQCVPEHGGFFARQIPARFFLNHRQLINEHPREIEVHLALACLRIRNLAEEQRGVLRLHHHELDEALRELA